MGSEEGFCCKPETNVTLFACTAATGLICSAFIKRRSLSRVHEVVKVGLPENTEGIMLEDRGNDITPLK
jgi:hypothetical protein